MRFLIIFSPPSRKSYSAALFKTVETSLKKKGHEVKTLDLYKQDKESLDSEDEELDLDKYEFKKDSLNNYEEDKTFDNHVINCIHNYKKIRRDKHISVI